MAIRKCLSCHHEFDASEFDYERCPECGAGAYPLKLKDAILEGKMQVTEFTKCSLADNCITLKNYRPECEDLVFTPNCLAAIQSDVLSLRADLHRIQSHLGIKLPPHQSYAPDLDG